MSTKVCTGPCGKELSEDQYHWRNKAKGQRVAWCKLCWSAYSKQHYQRNKKSYKTKARKWNAKCREQVFQQWLAYMREHPCVDCGEPDPVVLTFDHVRGHKQANVAHMMAGKLSWPTILKEIEKCDVRCSNCHLRRTAKQFGWHRSLAGVAPRRSTPLV